MASKGVFVMAPNGKAVFQAKVKRDFDRKDYKIHKDDSGNNVFAVLGPTEGLRKAVDWLGAFLGGGVHLDPVLNIEEGETEKDFVRRQLPADSLDAFDHVVKQYDEFCGKIVQVPSHIGCNH